MLRSIPTLPFKISRLQPAKHLLVTVSFSGCRVATKHSFIVLRARVVPETSSSTSMIVADYLDSLFERSGVRSQRMTRLKPNDPLSPRGQETARREPPAKHPCGLNRARPSSSD